MSVIIRPLITEKQTAAAEKLNRFAFQVADCANKIEIRNAVEALYNVKVDKVWTQNFVGKVKTRNTRRGPVSGRVNATKKAVVSLAAGDTIDFYANI